MTTAKNLNIYPIGLSQTEVHVLSSLSQVSRLSSRRPRSYAVMDTVLETLPDIYLVNGDDRDSVATWKTMHVVHQAPTLFFGADSAKDRERSKLPRPIIPARLLAALDGVNAIEHRILAN